MDQSTLQRLNELGDRLEGLNKPLRITQYNAPLNRDEEKEKLLTAHARGEQYNPQFAYRETPEGWDQPLREFLKELQPDENLWEQWIYRDVEQTLEALRAAETHDPEFITAKTVASYGEPSIELVKAAREELTSLGEEPNKRSIPAQDIATHMRDALEKAGLTEWSVIVDEAMNARMSVRGVDKQVKVRNGEFFTAFEMKRLLVHEIGTHVFRSVNGNLQPLRLLRFGFDNYLLTEEGLATFHENHYGVRNTEDQRRYALRVIAAHLSLSHSFYAVFYEIAQHTTSDEAFEIVVRAKRGFRDTSVAGSHVKDKVYFEGFRKVTAHLKDHPDDYSLLMTGKISINMLSMLKVLDKSGLLVPPKYLPDMLVS